MRAMCGNISSKSQENIKKLTRYGLCGIFPVKLIQLITQLLFHFQIEVIPWVIADSNYLKSSSQKLDPAKTVFVGALHGQLTAKGLAQIMDDIFKGVIYAGTL